MPGQMKGRTKKDGRMDKKWEGRKTGGPTYTFS